MYLFFVEETHLFFLEMLPALGALPPAEHLVTLRVVWFFAPAIAIRAWADWVHPTWYPNCVHGIYVLGICSTAAPTIFGWDSMDHLPRRLTFLVLGGLGLASLNCLRPITPRRIPPPSAIIAPFPTPHL